jgi:hypothetical protein
MAGTATNNKLLSMTGSAEKASITQGNALIVDVELLRAQLALTQAKVNAIITAAATDIAAVAAVTALTTTAVDAAGDLTAALVKDVDGTTI